MFAMLTVQSALLSRRRVLAEKFMYPAMSVGGTEEWELQARLLQALKTNDIHELDFLLSDSSIDIADLRFFPQKRPAICISVEHGCYEITKFLLTLGANVNDQVCEARVNDANNKLSFQDEQGNTPLHLAVRERRRNFVHLLLRERANVNILNVEATSPLHMAAICCKTEQSILTDLIQAGAKFNQANAFGQTPLLIACDRTHDRLVRMLLEYGATPNCRDLSGQTPLHYCNRLDYVTIQLLLDAGAPVNTPDMVKRRPLHILAGDRLTDSWRASAIAELLLQYRAKVDARDGYKRTPLMVAMYEGNLVLAKLFIRAGCSVQANVADALGNTPLALALRSFSGDFELIKMLLDSGANMEAWMHQLIENFDDRYVGSMLSLMRSRPKILPLTYLCRMQIRNILSGHMLSVIPNVMILPAAVKSFLLFK